MQTLKIEIPKGFEIDMKNFDPKTNTVSIKPVTPKDPIDRFKTIFDVLEDHSMTISQFNESVSGMSDDEKNYRLLKMITKSLNEGWQPDWNNTNEAKYFPYFEMGGSSGFRSNDFDLWDSSSTVGSRLCFKTSKLAEHASRTFTDVYKGFMLI